MSHVLARVTQHRSTGPWTQQSSGLPQRRGGCHRQTAVHPQQSGQETVSTQQTPVCQGHRRKPSRLTRWMMKQDAGSRAFVWPRCEYLASTCPRHHYWPHLASIHCPAAGPRLLFSLPLVESSGCQSAPSTHRMTTGPFINHLLCAPNTVLSLPKHQPSEEAPRSPQHMSTHQPLLSGVPCQSVPGQAFKP